MPRLDRGKCTAGKEEARSDAGLLPYGFARGEGTRLDQQQGLTRHRHLPDQFHVIAHDLEQAEAKLVTPVRIVAPGASCKGREARTLRKSSIALLRHCGNFSGSVVIFLEEHQLSLPVFQHVGPFILADLAGLLSTTGG
jgi:hypothetical protein